MPTQLTDVQSLQIVKEIFEQLNQPFKTKLPLDPVDVVDHRAAGDLKSCKQEWTCTKKLDGQRCLLYGRVCYSEIDQYPVTSVESKRELHLFVTYPDGTVELISEAAEPVSAHISSFLFDSERIGNLCYVFGTHFANGKVTKTADLAVQLCTAGLLVEEVPVLTQYLKVKQFFPVESARTVLDKTYTDLAHDGLVFTRRQTGSFKEGLALHIKWKPQHMLTVDFEIVVSDETDRADLLIDGRPQASADIHEWTKEQQKVVQEVHRQNTPCIAEMAPSLSCDTKKDIEWTLVRFRPDKTKSNHNSTYERNRRLFLNFITLESILDNKEDQPGVDHQYWTKQETLGKRALHPLRHMRNFHNACKSRVYETVFGKAVSGDVTNRYRERIHLELGYGRGGDTVRLKTYLPREYSRVVAVDIDEKALAEADRRWRTSANKRKHFQRDDRPKNLDCFVCDLSKNRDVDDLLGSDLRDIEWVDTAVAHFSLHYFQQNFRFICESLVRVGGHIGITMFCRRRVNAMLDQNDGIVQFYAADSAVNDDESDRRPLIELRGGADRSEVDVYIDSIGKWHTERLYDPEEVLGDDFAVVESFYFDQKREHRQYNSSSIFWPFTSLYKAVVFSRERFTCNAAADEHSFPISNSAGGSTGSNSFGSGSYPMSPAFPSSPAYRLDSPDYEPQSPIGGHTLDLSSSYAGSPTGIPFDELS